MKAIIEYWKSFSKKTQVSAVVILVAAVVFIALATSSRYSPPNASTLSPRAIAKKINGNNGTLVPMTIVVRGFAWQQADYTPFWNKYMYGVSRTAYVDYAIDVSDLKSDDITVEKTGDGKREVSITLPTPIVDKDTLRPPTQDKPIEFVHGETFKDKTKDETRDAVLGKVNEAIATAIQEKDAELTKTAKAFAREELGGLFKSIGFETVEINYK